MSNETGGAAAADRLTRYRVALHGNLAPEISKEVMEALSRHGISCRAAGHDEGANLRIVCSWPHQTGDLSELSGVAAYLRREASDTIIVLEAPDPLTKGFAGEALDEWNAELKALAVDVSAYFVPIRSKFLRWGPRECLAADFQPSNRGIRAIANLIVKQVVRAQATTAISGDDVTLTCSDTGQSLSKLLEIDPMAADELLLNMCSPVADVWPGFYRSLGLLDAGPPRPSKYDLVQAQKLQNGIISFPTAYGWPDFAIPDSGAVDWSQPGPDRSWQSMFLGLDFLRLPLRVVWTLLMESSPPPPPDWPTININATLERAIEVFLNFRNHNPPHAPATPRAWHEGTTQRRLRALLALLSCCLVARKTGIPLAPGVPTFIGLEISRSATLLASEATYMGAGNHGVRQDVVLYTVSRFLSHSKESAYWRNLALQRLEQAQLNRSISSDGVWLEHSVGYHSLVLDQLMSMDRVAAFSHDDLASNLLQSSIARLLRFFDFTVLPDQHPLLIGDTGPSSIAHLVERGASYPREQRKLVGMFPDAGYMISRPPVENDKTGLHVAFYANLKSSKHKQADDLAVFLQEGLTSWLVDGGSISKETSDLRRNVARFDPGAHSTYRVNHGGYSFNQRTAGKIKFLETYEYPNWCGASAVNQLYDAGEVTRFVIHVAEQRTVAVIDHLLAKGESPAKFEQFWHLAPNTCVTQSPGGFVAVQPGHPTHLSIAVDSSVEDTWDQWEGGEEQPIGWIMTSQKEVIPNIVLRRTFTAHSRWSVTAFSLGRPGNSFHVREIQSSNTRATTTLVEGDSHTSITVNLTGAISLESKHAPR